MDSKTSKNLQIIQDANKEMLNYFNKSFLQDLENIQSIKKCFLCDTLGIESIFLHRNGASILLTPCSVAENLLFFIVPNDLTGFYFHKIAQIPCIQHFIHGTARCSDIEWLIVK